MALGSRRQSARDKGMGGGEDGERRCRWLFPAVWGREEEKRLTATEGLKNVSFQSDGGLKWREMVEKQREKTRGRRKEDSSRALCERLGALIPGF